MNQRRLSLNGILNQVQDTLSPTKGFGKGLIFGCSKNYPHDLPAAQKCDGAVFNED
jgi:hypothetical protein